VPYRGFPTSNGSIFLGGANDKLFGILCARIGQPALASSPLYSSNALRVANRDSLEALVGAITATRTTAEWLAALDGCGMPYAAINDVKDSLEHAHTQARGMVVEVQHASCGPVKLVNSPVRFSGCEPGVRSAPPVLGEHTDEVLRGCGIGDCEIARLREDGVVA